MKPLPSSNMKAKPQAQKVTPQMQVSTMPSTRMLMDSRERAKPASSMTKPTCMPNTRNAAISVHEVLIAFISGVGPAGAAGTCACTPPPKYRPIAVSRSVKPIALPPISARTFVRMTGSLKLSTNVFRSVVNRMCRFSMCDRAETASHTVPVCGRGTILQGGRQKCSGGYSRFFRRFSGTVFQRGRVSPYMQTNMSHHFSHATKQSYMSNWRCRLRRRRHSQ